MEKKRRNRFKQTSSLDERLTREAKRLKREARKAPPGSARESLFRKARQMERAKEMSEFLAAGGH